MPQPVKQMHPYLIVSRAADAIAFYVAAFGAREIYRLVDPADGRIGHAELDIGGTRLLLADEYRDFGAVSPATLGGSPVKFQLEVADADAFLTEALRHGATQQRAVRLEFHGYRSGMVLDPFGYSWFISSKVEELTVPQMQRRWDAGLAEAGA